MIEKKDLPKQTNLAFDFIQKLYVEASYFIKEMEGLLYEEAEKFVIGRPAGYGISTRSSTGLESNNVNFWLLRKFAVFFVPENVTKTYRGKTIASIDNGLKVLYVRLVLNDKQGDEPRIHSGVFYNIAPKAKWLTKFENVMGHFAYIDEKLFRNPSKVDFEDNNVKLKGDFITNNLFDINASETILKKVIEPSLLLYRKY